MVIRGLLLISCIIATNLLPFDDYRLKVQRLEGARAHLGRLQAQKEAGEFTPMLEIAFVRAQEGLAQAKKDVEAAAEQKRVADAAAAEQKRVADAAVAEQKRVADAAAAERRREAEEQYRRLIDKSRAYSLTKQQKQQEDFSVRREEQAKQLTLSSLRRRIEEVAEDLYKYRCNPNIPQQLSFLPGSINPRWQFVLLHREKVDNMDESQLKAYLEELQKEKTKALGWYSLKVVNGDSSEWPD